MSSKGVRIAVEVGASLLLAAAIYWVLSRILSAFAGLLDSHSGFGQALSTLLIFLSPGYLGPLLLIALASSLFALFSYYRGDDDARGAERWARRPGPRAGHVDGGGPDRSGSAKTPEEAVEGRRPERAAWSEPRIRDGADPAAHPALPRS